MYLLTLSLLIGGNVLYTYLATPAVFRAFERALAGEVVAAMMPGYFGWNLVLWIAAALLGVASLESRFRGVKFVLLGIGLAAALAVSIWLYPNILGVRSQVASFAADAPMTAARLQFRRLHAVSMVLNLVQLLASAALMVLTARRDDNDAVSPS
jgi:hypothetical protein